VEPANGRQEIKRGAIAHTPAARASQTLHSEFVFDQPMQMRRDGWMIETLDDFVQKSSDEEPLGNVIETHEHKGYCKEP
jgi:hypothetical protein